MTSYKQLPILTGSSSKADEKEFIAIVREAAGEQTYVADFISADAQKWFNYRVDSDFDTDLHAALEHSQQQYRQQSANLAQANSRIEALQNELALARISIEHKNDLLQDAENRERELIERSQKQEASFERLLEVKDQLEAGYVVTIDDLKLEHEQQLATMAEEIRRLKAEVYDLEHARK